MSKRNERHFTASVFDGRGIAYVWIVDGYGRRVSDTTYYVIGVHTAAEAIAAAKTGDCEVLTHPA